MQTKHTKRKLEYRVFTRIVLFCVCVRAVRARAFLFPSLALALSFTFRIFILVSWRLFLFHRLISVHSSGWKCKFVLEMNIFEDNDTMMERKTMVALFPIRKHTHLQWFS